jgi:hypothetical protein
MSESFIFWWSIVSTIIGIILLCITIWQTKTANDEKKRSASQVKIWMQDANGISLAMQRIVSDNLDKRYSTTDDMANSIFALQTMAFSLYQSLYEERCITEEEYKEQKKKFKIEFEKKRQNTIPEDNSSIDMQNSVVSTDNKNKKSVIKKLKKS